MGLVERLSDPESIPHHNAGCDTGKLLQRLPDGEAEALRGALADPAWRTTWIVKALQDDGYQLSSYTVARHRKMLRGEDGCRCDEAGLT